MYCTQKKQEFLVGALEKKMDISDFDQRLANVQTLIDNWNAQQEVHKIFLKKKLGQRKRKGKIEKTEKKFRDVLI